MENATELDTQNLTMKMADNNSSSIHPFISHKKDDFGVCVHEIFMDDTQTIHLENLSNAVSDFTIPYIRNAIIFQYQFSGKGELSINDEKIKLKANEQSFYINNEMKHTLSLSPSAVCCIIQLNSKTVEKYFQEMQIRRQLHFPHHPETKYPFHKHQLPLTPPMRDCIDEIFRSERRGIFLRLQLESNILRLIMLQFEQMENHDCELFCSLKRNEVNKIYKAKKKITDHLNRWYTISELSAMVGTNECSLKKGFKEVYGSPIFEFIQNYKMKEAYKMLYDTELNIFNISDKLGYKNATHFSAAFKRKFGVSPTTIKQKRISLKI
ncbi:helix-turn-helix domain-containing protein [Sphingobacterium sp. ML3W]|uniref:helix-turn-helix domain-containing protein n=1 Tax=Sphingobacterium sp. ML3W TaxID=1538644 RepID=UPI00068B8E05|nr:AraC family transcriptional regulator [Sphingobacterium sp. ML3W]